MFKPIQQAMLLAALANVSQSASAFEDTKVLPKGVRNLSIRTVNTNFDQSTDPSGSRQPIAHQLYKELSLTKVAREETPLKRQQLKGFLLQNGIDEKDSVGSFSADIKGHLTVIAPILAYGVTSKMTFALAVPYYQAQTTTNVGFRPNERAASLLSLLAKPENNQIANGREAALKLNDAVNRLNNKIVNNGYRPLLENWQDSGPGDTTAAVKYQYINNSMIGLASTTGLVMPTGRQHDPNTMNDVPFGEGVWAPFAMIALDEKLPYQMTVNQFVKFTEDLPNRKKVRAITYDEMIEVDTVTARYKKGDKIDAGTSLRYEPSFGLLSGIGYRYFRKYGDVYRGVAPDTKMALQRWTDHTAHNAEFMLGYSTVQSYQAGRAPLPFSVRAGYVKQLASRNMPITDLAEFGIDLFF